MTYFYSLIIHDGNRHLSRRINSNSDCTVRALSIVTGASFDDAYDLLARAGRKPHKGFEIDQWLARRRTPVFGGTFKRIPVLGCYEAISPLKTPLTPVTFPIWHPKGRYLVTTSDHVYPILDSIAYDLRRVKEQPLESAWLWTPTLNPRASK